MIRQDRVKKVIKVSVVVPVYNVEKYLRQCLESLVNQTLREMEIICVNDGSTDSSPQIIEEYMRKDSRVRMISKENTGYGHSMNCGFDQAQGEYVGIVESDDYAEPDMFEKLYHAAHAGQLDVSKAGFFFYYSMPEEKNIRSEVVSREKSGRTFCPTKDFRLPLEMADFFSMKPTIWSAIYRTAFIRENGIRFLETPGASYQDAGFNFKVLLMAEKMQLLHGCYLHYRQDNENSSVNSEKKVYCVCDEYQEMKRFLNSYSGNRKRMERIRNRMKYDSYMWNLERLAPQFRRGFVEHASDELRDNLKNEELSSAYFETYDWKDLKLLTDDPEKFYRDKVEKTPPHVIRIARGVIHVCQRRLRKIRGRVYLWKKDRKSQ